MLSPFVLGLTALALGSALAAHGVFRLAEALERQGRILRRANALLPGMFALGLILVVAIRLLSDRLGIAPLDLVVAALLGAKMGQMMPRPPRVMPDTPDRSHLNLARRPRHVPDGLVKIDAANAAIDRLAAEGWRVFRLDTGINSRDSLVRALRRTLPLDPPLGNDAGWDALFEALWAGLDALPDQRILIVWPDAGLLEPALRDTVDALFRDLVASLADVEMTIGNPKTLLVYQLS